MKSRMYYRVAYLDLTLASSKGQGQGHEQFNH